MAEPTFQQLTEQVQKLTQRVAALERELGLRAAAKDVEPSPESRSQPSREFLLKQEQRADAQPVRDLESRVGLRLVNRVGAITLILGVAFFFRYAVENNLIGETARVLLGVTAGLLLLGAGEFWFRRTQLVFSQGITGAGSAILYLSCYAAFNSYDLISFPIAFFSLTGVTTVSAALAMRYKSQAIALLALFGGLLVPLLLHGNRMSAWLVPLYLAVLDAAFLQAAQEYSWTICDWLALGGTALFAARMEETPFTVLLPVYYLLFVTRKNRFLFLAAHILLLERAALLPQRLSLYAPIALATAFAGLVVVRWRKWFELTAPLVGAAALSWLIAGTHLPLAGALATASALFALFLIASLEPQAIWALPLNGVLYFAACYARLEGWANSWAALLSLTLAGVYLLLAFVLRELPAMLCAGLSVALLTAAIPIEFSAFRITAAWALEGAALVWIGAKRGVPAAQTFGFCVLLGASLHFVFADLTLHPGAPIVNARFCTAAGVAVALFLAAMWSNNPGVVPPEAPGIAGHLVMLVSIAFEVVDQTAETNAASAVISILFAIYAVILVAVGTATRTSVNRYAGLALIALVVMKLYLYDVWQLDTVYRFIAFAALGALLLATSFLYSRYRDRIASWLTLPGVSEAHQRPPQE